MLCFSLLAVCVCIFCRKNIGKKVARKMLVKLTISGTPLPNTFQHVPTFRDRRKQQQQQQQQQQQ